MPILATKLYIPKPQPNSVRRPRLTGRLNEGLQRKLTFISASAGSGKTTLVRFIRDSGRDHFRGHSADPPAGRSCVRQHQRLHHHHLF